MISPRSAVSSADVSTQANWDCHLHAPAPIAGHAERRVLWVVWLTVVAMVAELVAGYFTGSLALVADGWHMASHAGALGISSFAYWMARTRATHRGFAFGTGKIYALAGYTNAIALALVAILMAIEAVQRLYAPVAIAYNEAILVAFVGLLINLASVKLLDVPGQAAAGHGHDHGHADHHHAHADETSHEHQGSDHNLRAAYFHVLADALTSVLAIAGLVVGRFLGWWYFDPLVAFLGGVIILRWAYGLCRATARQLLDFASSGHAERRICEILCGIDDVQVVDLHLWELAHGRHGCVVSIRTSNPRDVAYYRERILDGVALAHLTVEVQRG